MNQVFLQGEDIEHVIGITAPLNKFDSITLSPKSLMFSTDYNFIKIRPKNIYKKQNYNYEIKLWKNREATTIRDSFEVCDPINCTITSTKMNFLILGERNPVNIATGFIRTKDCTLTSNDMLTIERIDNEFFFVTPHKKGVVVLELKVKVNGQVRTLMGYEFIVVENDTKFNEVRKERHANTLEIKHGALCSS
nr:hypothetical protein [uncultured Carboxylicivirga sp.]